MCSSILDYLRLITYLIAGALTVPGQADLGITDTRRATVAGFPGIDDPCSPFLKPNPRGSAMAIYWMLL